MTPYVIETLGPFRQHRSCPEGHPNLPGVTPLPLTWPLSLSPSQPSSHKDPNLRSALGASIRDMRWRQSRCRGR